MTFLPILCASTLILGLPQEAAAPSAPRDEAISLHFEDAEVHEVLTTIARTSGANLVISPAVSGLVSIKLQEVPWRVALQQVAEQRGCVVEDFQGVLRVSPAEKREGPRVAFNFLRTEAQEVLSVIAKISGANVVIDPEVKGKVTVRLRNIPWRQALEIIADTSGWVVESLGEEGSILRIRNR